jgi:hypothetical protein
MEPTVDPAERNKTILRRTLAAVSWIYALWSFLLGAAGWLRRSEAIVDPRLILLHAALFSAAAVMLWRPRRGAVECTMLAAAGSIFFVVEDLRRGSVEAALVDGAYIVLAAALLYKTRRDA